MQRVRERPYERGGRVSHANFSIVVNKSQRELAIRDDGVVASLAPNLQESNEYAKPRRRLLGARSLWAIQRV